MQNLYSDLEKLLKQDERLFAEGKILKNKVSELAIKLDTGLLELLFKDKQGKEHFFIEIAGKYVFNQEKFLKFINNKEFLPDSFTAFKNHIGLTEGDEYIKDNGKVVLSWPYKDCILEGGQDKEDVKRKEIFYNETLAPDEIDRLFEPKVLTNFKMFDATGQHKIGQITKKDNLIVKGNNLLALHSLKKKYRGEVTLIYIDPPFNTGNDSFRYNDSFNHSTWLTFMKNRLEVAREFLSEDGNIFIHIDVNEAHYLKMLCDDIFQRENFVEEIIWAYGSPSGGRAAGAKPVNIHDYILHYAKNYSQRKQNKIYTPYSEQYLKDWFKYKEKDGRAYRRRMRDRDEKGNVVWEKQYLDESKGLPLTTVWSDIKQVYADPRAYKENQNHSVELIKGFLTQKPEKLIQRILEMASDPGDLVLDYHLGSGTTVVVAHKMGRRYIGIEQLDYEKNDAVNRLKNIIKGDQTGISKVVNWKGGGSFVYMELRQWNEAYTKAIQEAETAKELSGIYKKMQTEAFFRYEIDLNKFDQTQFGQLGLSDQKKVLLECLDKNHIYVNYGEMEDATYRIPADEKKINMVFYGN